MAGEHEQEQMQRIVELRGLPPRAMLERAPRRELFFCAAGTPLVPQPSADADQVRCLVKPTFTRKLTVTTHLQMTATTCLQ